MNGGIVSKENGFGENAWDFFTKGYPVLPIHKGKKYPSVKGWPRLDITPDVVKGWKDTFYNYWLGVRLGDEGLCALDVDVEKVEFVDAFRALLQQFNVDFIERTRLGSGRVLFLFRCEDTLHKVVSDKWDLGRVELLGRGQQCVLLGGGRKLDRVVCVKDLEVCSADTVAEVLVRVNNLMESAGGVRLSGRKMNKSTIMDKMLRVGGSSVSGVSNNIDVDDVWLWLDSCRSDDDCWDRQEWLYVGMLLNAWDSDKGLSIFHEWSAMDPVNRRYDPNDLERVWASMDPEGGLQPSTILWEISHGRGGLAPPDTKALEELKEQVSKNTSDVIMEGELQDGDPVWLLRDALKLAGEVTTGDLVRHTGRPETLLAVVQQCFAIMDTGDIVNLRSRKVLSSKAFDANWGVPVNVLVGNKVRQKPCSMVFRSDDKTLRGVRVSYAPGQSDTFWRDGDPTVNLWRGWATKPSTAGKGWAALVRWAEWFCHRQEEANMLLDWLAWSFQYPSKRNCGLILTSRHGGNGKTSLMSLVAALAGRCNAVATTIESLLDGKVETFETKFMMIDEVSSGIGTMRSRSRVEARLKEFVDTRVKTIELNQKFVAVRNVDCFFNFIGSTNHVSNALHLGKDDRRFMVLGSTRNVQGVDASARDVEVRGLWTLEEEGLLDDVMAGLMERDVSSWNPSVVKNTVARMNVIAASATYEDSFFDDMPDEGVWMSRWMVGKYVEDIVGCASVHLINDIWKQGLRAVNGVFHAHGRGGRSRALGSVLGGDQERPEIRLFARNAENLEGHVLKSEHIAQVDASLIWWADNGPS